MSNAGLRNALEGASSGSPLIPQLLYAFFQMEFACVTVRDAIIRNSNLSQYF